MTKQLQVILALFVLFSATLSYSKPTVFLDTSFKQELPNFDNAKKTVQIGRNSRSHTQTQDVQGYVGNDLTIRMIVDSEDFIKEFSDKLSAKQRNQIISLKQLTIKLHMKVTEKYLIKHRISQESPIKISTLLNGSISKINFDEIVKTSLFGLRQNNTLDFNIKLMVPKKIRNHNSRDGLSGPAALMLAGVLLLLL